MSTATTATTARRAAVRVGARTHVGYLSCDRDADGGPLYVPACGAGQRNGAASPRCGVTDRVDCGNCGRRYADVVTEMNAAHDAATGRADVRDTDDRPVPTLTAPTPEILDVGRALGPAATWAEIQRLADAHPLAYTSARLRAAWIREALREVYGLSMSATVAEILDTAAADGRDAATRARDCLAAYAGQIDNRAHRVDMYAAAFQTHDIDQAHAGVRPYVGTWVFVAGHAGRWEVMRRSPTEERRSPFRIRVRQEGHTFNGSVHLSAVTPIPPAPAVVDVDGWVPAVTADVQDEDGVREESMRDAADGGRAAEVWAVESQGWTRAFRTSTEQTSSESPGRAEALTSVRILDTVTAGELAAMPAVAGERVTGGAAGRALILADGTRVRVLYAQRVDAGGVVHATPGGWAYTPGAALAGRVVSITVRVEGEPLPMRAPLPLNLPRTVDAPMWRLTLPLHGRVALAPSV